ncbi:uncharacterized protein LOC143607977 isoform X2 [Bidens hawaiensis]|uniref:uncharacterized protein LOC143607977 isoform X2 n=1 Tax=Bidens hawaiensis TaxID=980011 RepID=UPI0040495C4E
MAESGGGNGSRDGSRGGGARTCGRKVAPEKRVGSGTRDIHIQEPDSCNGARDNSERRESQGFNSKGKGKKPVERENRQTCGRYVVTRGGKGGGVAGSHSRVASGDEMADMAGVIRNQLTLQNVQDDEYAEVDDSDEDDGSQHDDVSENDGSGKADDFENASFEDTSGQDVGDNRRIARMGRKFGFGYVHRSAGRILDQKLDGDWITFKKIPHSALRDMFNTFRTQWRWDPRDDQHIFEGFVNVLKDRYPDKMSDLCGQSKKKAREDNHFIEDGKHRFDIIRNYPPDKVPGDRWKRWCKVRVLTTFYDFFINISCSL